MHYSTLLHQDWLCISRASPTYTSIWLTFHAFFIDHASTFLSCFQLHLGILIQPLQVLVYVSALWSIDLLGCPSFDPVISSILSSALQPLQISPPRSPPHVAKMFALPPMWMLTSSTAKLWGDLHQASFISSTALLWSGSPNVKVQLKQQLMVLEG